MIQFRVRSPDLREQVTQDLRTRGRPRAPEGLTIQLSKTDSSIHTSKFPRCLKASKATHRSLLNELTDARINKARDLLASTRLSIKEIADLTGMPDQSGFSKVYKRETGETPSAFRQRVRPAMS